MDKPIDSLDMNFCRRCGTPLKNVEGIIFRCGKGHQIFANSDPCVGIYFITADNRILLSVRGIEPSKGKLDAFGGFLGMGETFEEAAMRELKEELSLEPDEYEELRYICSGIGSYLYKGETLPLISTHFWTKLTTSKPLRPTDDVAAIRSFPMNDVDFSEIYAPDVKIAVKKLQQLLNGIQ